MISQHGRIMAVGGALLKDQPTGRFALIALSIRVFIS